MKSFQYYQPTEIQFGPGKVNEIGEIGSKFGKNCLLVTTPAIPVLEPMYNRIKGLLCEAGMNVTHFDQVQPNPTTDNITVGAEVAKANKADVVIGLGGGDTQPTKKTLPIIAISTTSGTGSQVTQVAVVTNTEKRDKSAIYNSIVFPRVCVVDPELIVTLPKHMTAATGFDAFCHAFESMLNPGASPYTDTLAVQAIQLIAENLPAVLKDLNNLELRGKMALADTLAGLCIANSGVTLPHGVGMAISGMYPHVAHGESLAIIYPAFTRFTYSSAIQQFSTAGRIFDAKLNELSDNEAAEKSCEVIDAFIETIDMTETLKDAKMPEEEITALAKQSMVLPDYQGNPRVATEEEMLALIKQAYYGI